MAKSKSQSSQRGFRFRVAVDGKPKTEVPMALYAFDSRGRLLTSAPLQKEQARLNLNPQQMRRAQLLVGPILPEGRFDEEISRETLAHYNVYEPVWRFNPEQFEYELQPVPEFHWVWWLWCSCRVRGQVVRPVALPEETVDMPVCHARVHICEVDPFYLVLRQVPDEIIWRLRDELLVELERHWPPIPQPDPPPFVFDPGYIDPVPEVLAQLNREAQLGLSTGLDEVGFNPQPDPPAIRRLSSSLAASHALRAQPELNDRLQLTQFSLETRAAFTSNSVNVVRNALLDNVHIIIPYLCLWPWFWPFLTCEELAVLETDENGRFDTTIWYRCFGDHPDLYFWVEYSIGGTWTTVYRPPMRCYTYWNYECGSEVTIRITDPRVSWCGEVPSVPGSQLAVLTIGRGVSIPEIQNAAAGSDEGLTTDGEPFGGSLEPHVWFGEDIIDHPAIEYYRWSYRPLGGSEDDWTILDREVIRHYAEEASDGTLTFKAYKLGPVDSITDDIFFQIQPRFAPGGVNWAPMVDPRSNTASAYFKSHTLDGGNALTAAGKYELKLELFKTDRSLVNFTAEGINVKVPTTAAPFGNADVPTTAAPPYNLLTNGSGDVVGFRMVLHVDNNPCVAQIYPVEVQNGTDTEAAGPCGFIEYTNKFTSDATISFRAHHPNDFATFNFRVTKGSSGPVTAVGANGTVGDSPVNGYSANSANVYTRSGIPVVTLLGDCPDRAAFAETLYVDAMATDGWSTLQYLDANATPLAFALAPEE